MDSSSLLVRLFTRSGSSDPLFEDRMVVRIEVLKVAIRNNNRAGRGFRNARG